jgi:hypothetical protein
MRKLKAVAAFGILLLVGCAQNAPKKAVTPAPQPVAVSQPAAPLVNSQPENSHAKNMQQCRKELEAMQTYSQASYDKYLSEVQKLTATINRYRQVESSVSPEINDIMLPKTEFQMRELCFRIKSRLLDLMVKAA